MASPNTAQRSSRSKTTSRAKKASSQNGKKASRKNGKHASRLTAATADKHILYQKSVQEPSTEVRFMERVFRAANQRRPLTMREDFCGTSLLCCEWVKGSPDRSATGVDIDKKVLAWGVQHNHSAIGDDAQRITLLQQDVREPSPGRFDIVCAFNFSYWVFKTRDELRKYFASVRKGLKNTEGLFLLDAYGGWESQEPMFEPRKIKGGFTYVWDQDKFDPITHEILNHIHFEFKDGTKLEKAFTYDWRYWTLPELRELLAEAGYSDVRVYWDCSDDNDTEDYRVKSRAENQPGWLAYLVAKP